MDEEGGGEGWADNREREQESSTGGWRLAVASVGVGSMLIFSGSCTRWLQLSGDADTNPNWSAWFWWNAALAGSHSTLYMSLSSFVSKKKKNLETCADSAVRLLWTRCCVYIYCLRLTAGKQPPLGDIDVSEWTFWPQFTCRLVLLEDRNVQMWDVRLFYFMFLIKSSWFMFTSRKPPDYEMWLQSIQLDLFCERGGRGHNFCKDKTNTTCFPSVFCSKLHFSPEIAVLAGLDANQSVVKAYLCPLCQ